MRFQGILKALSQLHFIVAGENRWVNVHRFRLSATCPAGARIGQDGQAIIVLGGGGVNVQP